LQTYLEAGVQADVLVIATPNGLHTAQAQEALLNGLHVVIEKPMGLKKADCEAVIDTARQQEKQVFCVMQNRYSPPSAWLKSMVTEKRFGDIFMVQVNCYWNRDERYYHPGNWKGSRELDGGTLFTQFSHFVDMMYWLFGDIDHIRADFADFNHGKLTAFEDSGFVHFQFMQGGHGILNYTTSVWDKNLESSMTVIGSKGTVKIGGQYMDQVEYCHVQDYEMPQLAPTNPANDYGTYKGSAANHHYIIANVIDTLKERSEIMTNAVEGMKVVDIIERIYACKHHFDA
jgi:predicted dehydrogenase